MDTQEPEPTDKPPRPVIDYANLPHLPREGIQMANNKYATRALFLETAAFDQKPTAPWCLSEHEIFAYGRWYPSAWMTYLHATDEYDAIRKICGNVHQWERLKQMTQPKVFADILANWKLEQAYLQKSILKERLMREASAGTPGYTSATRILLQLIDGDKPTGRPKKVKESQESEKERRVEADHARVVNLFK